MSYGYGWAALRQPKLETQKVTSRNKQSKTTTRQPSQTTNKQHTRPASQFMPFRVFQTPPVLPSFLSPSTPCTSEGSNALKAITFNRGKAQASVAQRYHPFPWQTSSEQHTFVNPSFALPSPACKRIRTLVKAIYLVPRWPSFVHTLSCEGLAS